jgi:isocitrate lyase
VAVISPRRRFRELLASGRCLYTSGIHEPLEAKIAEAVGLPFAYVSGYSCSLGYLARADLGFATMTEMSSWAGAIARAVSIPVVADADDGYGGVLATGRTVEEFERAGVAGINIEDQRFPKRCGHLPGKQCLSLAESVMKLRAALDARSDPDFTIIARTDVLGAGGQLDDAVERAKRYAGEGADLVWCEFPTPDRSAVETFAGAVRREFPELPLFFNYSSSFDWTSETDPLDFPELAAMGYRVIVVGLGSIHAAMHAVWEFMSELGERGHEAQIALQRRLRGHPTADHHAMGDMERYRALERRYALRVDGDADG